MSQSSDRFRMHSLHSSGRDAPRCNCRVNHIAMRDEDLTIAQFQVAMIADEWIVIPG